MISPLPTPDAGHRADVPCVTSVVPPAAQRAAPSLPRTPQAVDATGLSLTFLAELTAKVIYQLGLTHLLELGGHLCLSAAVIESTCQFMRREGLLEVTRRGQHEADVQVDLTGHGRARAAEWLQRSGYIGPAPVPLDVYTERVRLQSVQRQRIDAERVDAALAGLVIAPRLRELLGTAVNSGRPMLLHGASGSGKTYLAERLFRLVPGTIAVPHSILVHGEVIRVFDAQCHKPVAAAPAVRAAAALDNRHRPDPRWVMCERPVVVSGGELTLEMLDLSFDARAGYYEAPPHFKANNGIFIVDDLGRQVISPRALMNRWIVPMERRHDHLMLRNGGKFTIPFDLVLVFSSNLAPADLDDAAFLRRLGHKIEIGPVSPEDYRCIFEGACAGEGLEFDADGYTHLLEHCHGRDSHPLLACIPRDLLHLVASRAAYLGEPARLTPDALDWAWQTYFGRS